MLNEKSLNYAAYLCESESEFASLNWQPCVKIEYDIQVYVPPTGTKVYNFLEDSSYVTNDQKPYVLVGTVGEEWTVNLKKILTAYTFEGKPITEDVVTNILSDGEKHTIRAIAGAEKFFAVQTKDQINVTTSWGEVLKTNRPEVKHGEGDYLICYDKNGSPDLNDMWVINGTIFPNTYKFV